ncbi:hypothetical protein [Streptomyces sp. NPDC056304]|uniref:hypothetical protein n=1 Tax=Streptomyces sp. NPDC056304 TaxID=3345778 RepID=UPI0035D9123D
MSQVCDDFHQADKTVAEPRERDASGAVVQAESLLERDLGEAGEVCDSAFGLRSLCQGDDQLCEPGGLGIVGGSFEPWCSMGGEAVWESPVAGPVDALEHGVSVSVHQCPIVYFRPELLAPAVTLKENGGAVSAFELIQKDLGLHDFGSL